MTLIGWLCKQVQFAAEYQMDTIRLTTLVPGVRFEQVTAALAASGYQPAFIYRVAVAGEPLPEAFREALYEPEKEGIS